MKTVPATFRGGPVDGLETGVTPVEPFAHWVPRRLVVDGVEYRYAGCWDGVAHYSALLLADSVAA